MGLSPNQVLLTKGAPYATIMKKRTVASISPLSYSILFSMKNHYLVPAPFPYRLLVGI